MIRQSYQLLGFVFMTLIALAYYGLGAEKFPDYENYITIATNNGWLFNEDEYLFEWVSRGLLTLPMQMGLQPHTAVDLLALINQIICIGYFGWLLTSDDRARNFGATLLIALAGVLLITTTLRASTAYLALSWYVLRQMKLDFTGIAILMMGLAWHDSFMVPAVLSVIAHVWVRLERRNVRHTGSPSASFISLDQFGVLSALAMLALAEPLRDAVLAALNLDLGIRSIYLDGDGAQSAVKLIYCGICQLMCLSAVSDRELDPVVRRFSALMAVTVSLMYLVSGVVAVRFAVFAFCALVPLRGVFVLKAERYMFARLATLAVIPALLAVSAVEILNQTI